MGGDRTRFLSCRWAKEVPRGPLPGAAPGVHAPDFLVSLARYCTSAARLPNAELALVVYLEGPDDPHIEQWREHMSVLFLRPTGGASPGCDPGLVCK